VPALPVTIFTGFLGSGKTTLLASLLAAERDAHFAIVVNEFGEVSVDDVLLQQVRGAHRASVFKLTRGLIAYAGDDFLATMLAISDDARLFDHVLVETSGLAVPTAVLEALHSPALQERFIHDATLAIVDTPLLLAGVYDVDGSQHGAPAGTAASEVFQQQLMCADVVVLNKIDQHTEDELLRAETAIRTRASDVRFVELAWQARLDARLVLGLHLNEFRVQGSGAGMPAPAAGHAHGDGHAHSGLGAHEHGLLTHEHVHAEDPGWLSFVLCSQTSQEPDTLHRALDLITAQEPVLRVKGFAYIRDAAGHLLVQGVRTRIACTMETAGPSQYDSQHRAPHTPGPMAELVFIGYHLNRDMVVTKLSEHTGTAWY
jgi:cobalamin biosynthesis protein CobW